MFTPASLAMVVVEMGMLLLLATASLSAAVQVTALTGPSRLAPDEVAHGEAFLAEPVDQPTPLIVRWRDPRGRVGGQVEVTVPAGADRTAYALPIRHPISRRGWIEAVVAGQVQRPTAPFSVLFPPKPWDDYYAFVWAHYPKGMYDLLRQYGINGAMVYRDGTGGVWEAIKEADFAYYIDQMCWETYAFYHKARWAWNAVKEAYAKNPRDQYVTRRTWCLHEDGTYDRIERNYRRIIQVQRDDRPMFYNMADEIGIGDQSGPMDFCWEYSARDQWIEFLKRTYKDLDKLRREWEIPLSSWGSARSRQPTTYWQYARLWSEVYLPKSFRSASDAAVEKQFGTKFKSFEAIVDLYMSMVTSEKVDEQYVKDWLSGVSRNLPPAGSAGEDVTEVKVAVPDLARLNARYGTRFRTLQDVAAFYAAFEAWASSLAVDVHSTDASQMAGWNLSIWCDFREFMDQSVADAFARGREIARKYDPDGRFGPTGIHHPGVFSGHNYAKLCKVVDIIVPYNIGNTPEIIRSLYPDKCIQMGPSWFTGNQGVRDIWNQLLNGDRGIIFWDNEEPKHRFFTQDDRKPTQRAISLGPTLRQIESGIGKLLMALKRDNIKVALYYSHPAIRVSWWRQYLPLGRRWIELQSWHMYKQSWRNLLRSSWARLIEDCQLQYDFVSNEQVLDEDRLASGPYKVLILPEVYALSDAEADKIRRFVCDGGIVIADHSAGVMDEHGKWRERSVLADLWDNQRAFYLDTSMLKYAWKRTKPGQERPMRKAVERILFEVAGLKPTLRVIGPDGEPLTAAEVHTFRAGPGVRVIGIDRSIQRHPEGPGGEKYADNSAFEKVEDVTIVLDKPSCVYDILAGKYLGKHSELKVRLDPWVPTLWTLSDEPLPALRVAARPGEDGVVEIEVTCEPADVLRVARVKVFDPAGKAVEHYAANLRVEAGRAVHSIPFALNDPAGDWKVVVRDVATGQATELTVTR